MDNKAKCRKDLYRLLDRIVASDFYGKVEITFKDGVPVTAKQIKSIQFGLEDKK